MTDKVVIREAAIEDVERLDVIRRAIFPWTCASVAAQRKWFTSAPESSRELKLSAEVDGVVVGFAYGRLNVTAAQPGEASVYVIVHPDFRGQAIGKLLYEPIEDHLRTIEARRAQALALDSPDALAWAQRQGYELGASDRWSVVDPRDLPGVPDTPPGVTIASAAEVGPEALHTLDNAAFLDEPGDVPNGEMPYDDWMNRIWNNPDFDRDVSIVALVDGQPAALTFLDANRETGRAMSTGTCTDPRFRGRGLAKLIKSVSLRRAADAGVTAAFTANDYSNAPMLAINDWLGYRVIGGSYSVLKTLAR